MKCLLIFAIYFIGASRAQIPFFGTCPNVTVVSDFNATQILGKWYEVEKYFSIIHILSKCISVEFLQKDNETLIMNNKQIDMITQFESSSNTSIRLKENSTQGQFRVEIPFFPVMLRFTYDILATDYTTYAVVYSCSNIIGYNTKLLWILTRNRFPSDAIMENAYKAIDDNDLDRTLLSKTEQWQCPLFH